MHLGPFQLAPKLIHGESDHLTQYARNLGKRVLNYDLFNPINCQYDTLSPIKDRHVSHINPIHYAESNIIFAIISLVFYFFGRSQIKHGNLP
jgi:hypothetical protein